METLSNSEVKSPLFARNNLINTLGKTNGPNGILSVNNGAEYMQFLL